MDLGLAGKVAIITGGSEGIGRATAESLGREGASVVICARRADVLQRAAQDIEESTGAQVVPIVADVSRAVDVEHVVQATVARFGHLDILVNNAGRSANGEFEKLTAWSGRRSRRGWRPDRVPVLDSRRLHHRRGDQYGRWDVDRGLTRTDELGGPRPS